jgi:predicted amidohydrolase YtcJ
MDQAIQVLEALDSYSAAVTFQLTGEKKVPLSAGETCDFIVLDQNPLETAPSDLRNIKVLATFKAGQKIT